MVDEVTILHLIEINLRSGRRQEAVRVLGEPVQFHDGLGHPGRWRSLGAHYTQQKQSITMRSKTFFLEKQQIYIQK